MADNKFIAKLRGEATPKSVVEIKDDKIVKPLTGAPNSAPFESGIQDDTQSATVVANAAQNWVLNDGDLLLTNDTAYTGETSVAGEGLWVNSKYTFRGAVSPANPVVAIINPDSKWVFRMVGKNLASESEHIPFTMILTAGAKNVATATFSAKREANYFCKKFVLDFSETTAEQIKLNEGEELTIQLICEDPTASATIYNGSSVLSLLQRRVDASVVVSDNVSFDDLVERTDTLRNDLDDLGDQVQGIQALIPENASTENLLTTANDLKDEANAREEADTALDARLTSLEGDAVKKSATEMQTISGPLSVTDEICLVDGADSAAKHSLSIVAGIPTETATEMDIIGNRKYDTLPTTDDITSYDNLAPQKLVTKGQVATGIATAIAPLAVDANVVHKTGDETISGVKKFNDTLLTQDDTIDSSVNPAAVLTRTIVRTLDKNDNKIGSLYAQQDTDGTMRAILQCAKNDIVSELVAEILSDGTKQARAPTTPANASGAEIAVASWVRNLLNQYATPTGAVVAYAGTTAPAGFLICDGSAVSRTTYSALFAAIGTTYGAGDGNSTFNLPNAQDATLFALSNASWVGKRTNGCLPPIIGDFISENAIFGGASGVFSQIARDGDWVGSVSYKGHPLYVRLDAGGLYNTTLYSGTKAVPASLFVPHFIIKY